MVTYYSKNDMRAFGQHIANWIAQGMIQKNEKGFYPVTDGDIENWQTGVDVSFKMSSPPAHHVRSKCPKAREIVDALFDVGHKLFVDSDYELNWTTNIRDYAKSKNVVIAYYCKHSDKIEIAGHRPIDQSFMNRMEVYDSPDGKRIKTDIPVWCFPIYNEAGVHESTGIVFHVDDLKK